MRQIAQLEVILRKIIIIGNFFKSCPKVSVLHWYDGIHGRYYERGTKLS